MSDIEFDEKRAEVLAGYEPDRFITEAERARENEQRLARLLSHLLGCDDRPDVGTAFEICANASITEADLPTDETTLDLYKMAATLITRNGSGQTELPLELSPSDEIEKRQRLIEQGRRIIREA
jgi:hypothetical protein